MYSRKEGQMSHEKFPEPKGRYHRSIFSPLIVFFFKSKFSFLRSRLFKLAGFLEGGDFSSFTIRAILNTYYAIRAEEYSYGFNDLIDNIRIGDPQFITIGRYVSIASRVRIIRRNHPLGHLSTHPFFYDALRHIIKEDHKEKSIPLAIGHDAWIGFNSIILPGCITVSPIA